MNAYHQIFVRTDKPEHELIGDLSSDKSRQAQVAYAVFDRLGALGGYDLMLVFNLQRLLARI